MENSKQVHCSEKEQQNMCNEFHDTIEFIGKRWIGVIIYHLLEGPKRYHELMTAIPGISDRLLTERLKELENSGLVIKKVVASSPKKVEYELTKLGMEFDIVIEAIVKWVKKNNEDK
ncbi:DNA-binding HxlR family transcriptional regulator [Oikeobacillus pervagus]|uniref:DNA-binding HxlR family transcriptional regulator n=1 Tax=Oikeobacillus pervagus TaxID=1325931 RepID=A0AAJ1T6W4_9BACI|nr:helix-turn-helix domain-containing protein [Oikeobacillus pervagus]MDQ0216261.1 DNA-binding HxlR family transcriptional regulator [Oikeobacillus pervagus]